MGLEKAVFFNSSEKTPKYIYVQFNPESLEYSYGKRTPPHRREKSAWADENTQQSPVETWENTTLSMRLFFNTYTSDRNYTDVREKIKPLRALLSKTDKNQDVSNPRVEFAWGTFVFEGYLDGLQVTYQLFGSDGTPVRAEARVTISGDEADISPQLRKQLLDKAVPVTDGQAAVRQEFVWLFE